VGNNISVIIEVYNEESRLEACLINFKWAQELVVFVKKSNDQTLNIAKKYATHVYEVDYCDASENIVNNFKLHNSLEWCFYITASSRIDMDLVPYIESLTTDKNFNYDVIGLPYEMFVFNIAGPSSPWGSDYKFSLIRKNVLKLSNVLHQEVSWIGENTYLIDKKLTRSRFKHFTHKDPNDFFLRHNRYVSYEAKGLIEHYNTNAFRISLLKLFKSLAIVLIKKRTLYKGIDGFVLSVAYVSYYIMLLVYVWHYSKMSPNKKSE